MKVLVNAHEVFVGSGGVPWQADQRTLILQHGAGMDRTVWVLLARYFARHGFNVIAADLPGHGSSGGDALNSIQLQAAHLWQLVDVLQAEHGLPVGPVILAGHSMGALICVEAGAQRAAAVEQLVLFGAGYPMLVGQPLLDAARENSQSAADMIAVFSHSYGSQLGHNPVAGISVLNVAMALLEQAGPGVLHVDLEACNAYAGAQAAAKVLGDKQCTLIAGHSDRMTPMKAASALAQLLNANLHVLDDCGHMMMSEQPEATLQALRQILLQSQ